MEQNEILLAAAGAVGLNDDSLPDQLKSFYQAFVSTAPGTYSNDYIGGLGFGVDNMQLGPISITIDNTRMSVVDTSAYNPDKDNVRLIVLQGYAQISIFDRFYASCILVGKYSPADVTGIVKLVDHLTKTEEERDELRDKKRDEVTLHPSFYASVYNDPVNDAASTCGIYIIADAAKQEVHCDTVLQAIGVADFADNTAFGLAVAISANINTFTSTMDFTIAASVRIAQSGRSVVAGELGLLNNKINSIGITLKAEIPIATEVYLTYARISVRGFQEPKLAIALGGGVALGKKIRVPDGLGIVKKALFPNLKDFYPVELTVDCSINPARGYFSFSGKGVFMGNFAVSASMQYDAGNVDAELKAATVRNSYLSGSLSVDYHKRQDNWSLHANFSCSVSLDWKNLLGITVSGGVDVLLTSQDYTLDRAVYNRKDLTITVSGMGKVKIFFTVSVSVQKTWIFNLSNQKIADPALFMRSLASGETVLDNEQDVMVCECTDVAENKDLPVSISGDVIGGQSWTIDSACSRSGIVTFQIAAQYTLADTSWRLTHTTADGITVYTAENAGDLIARQDFAHNYYELVLDAPAAGDWTLEVLGDKQDSGRLYLDALQNEKIITGLAIAEQTDSVIRFKYSAHTISKNDQTLVRLFAEEISDTSPNPFCGVIAYLEEDENGEFVWEIPEEFSNNSRYRFYLSVASTDAAVSAESNAVEAYIDRQEADLECTCQLFYSATDTNTVTAYITITNSGRESTSYRWELLDYTNDDTTVAVDGDAPIADVVAAGYGKVIAGNSTITFMHDITVTEEWRGDFSSLQLVVSKDESSQHTSYNLKHSDDEKSCTDDAKDIMFAALDSACAQSRTLHWQAVEGAAYYLLQYALEGDWENSGIYVNGIKETSCTFAATPGEYLYRVAAMDENGGMIGDWSEVGKVDVFYSDNQTIQVAAGCKTSRSQEFSLNDGIYDLTGFSLENFSGSLVLYRNKVVKSGKKNSVKVIPSKVLTLTFDNGSLTRPVSDILLDHGDYFWEWKRKGSDIASDSEISVQLTGEVFSIEEKDRENITIGGEDSDVPLNAAGVYAETLDGEVGFCNKDAVYRYITDVGGELTLSVKSDTVAEAKFRVHIYVQSETGSSYTRVRSVSVNAGEYAEASVIVKDLAIKNNFYIQIVSWDNGRGKYNTDYTLDLAFDAFEDKVQQRDIIEVDSDPVNDWIGYRSGEHRYLVQIEADDLYSVRLQGDAGEVVLKVCTMQGKVIRQMQLQADGTANIDNLYLDNGNYFIVVESKDKGKGKYNTDYTLGVSKMQTIWPTEILSPDGDSVNQWVGFQEPAHTYRLEVESEDRYAIRLTGDANEAVLKICDLKGKVISRKQIQSDGTACIDDITLAEGNYFVVVESRDKGKGKYNTDYTLSAARLQTLYPEIDNSNDTWQAASVLDSMETAEEIAGWLGVGDTADFFKISLDFDQASPVLGIVLDEKTAQAIEDGVLKFSCLDERGRTLALYECAPGQLNLKKAVSGSDIYIGVTLKKPVESIDYSFLAAWIAEA